MTTKLIGRLGCVLSLLGLWLLTPTPNPNNASSGALPPPLVWPLTGGPIPNLPQSSAYGPRLKASENYRYDYHQGIDIPTPLSTTLVAVATGTVTIAGSSPNYSDGIVQLNLGNGLYSNYMHVVASLVTTGQVVVPGQPVALSGASEGGFPHLHFELRQGSVFRRDALNPWRFLPYTDTVAHALTVTAVLTSNQVWVRVTTPAHELDFNAVTLTVSSTLTQAVWTTRTLNYESRNHQFNGDPTQLDRTDLDGVVIQPYTYTTSSSWYRVDFGFHTLAGAGPVTIEACAFDVRNNRVCAVGSGTFAGLPPKIYLPGVRR